MTDFVQLAFNATGGSNPRKMPDRLADITNVKDWILPTDPDATNGIQKAVNHAMAAAIGGGIVFFPPGIYLISQPISCGAPVDAPVQLIGCGKGSTQINHNSSGFSDPLNLGYDLSGGYEINAFDNLERVEGIYGVSVRLTRAGSSTLSISGIVNGTSAKGCLIYSCTAAGNTLNANTWTGPPNMPGCTPGSIAFAVGTGAIEGCRGTNGIEVAYALSGFGSSSISNSWETAGCIVRMGWAFQLTWSGSLISSSSGNTIVFSKALPGEVVVGRFLAAGGNIPANTLITDISSDRKTIKLNNNVTGAVTSVTFDHETPVIGGAVLASETERAYSSIEFYNCNSMFVAGNIMTAGDGGVPPVVVLTATPTYNAGTGQVTMTSPVNLNFPGGIGSTQIIALGSDTPGGVVNTSWAPTADLLMLATQQTATTFTYPLGHTPSPWTTGTGDGWTWPQLAYMRFRKWKNCLVTANAGSRIVSLAGYDFDYGGQAVAGGGNVFEANDAATFGYIQPSNAATLASIKYLNQSQGTTFGQNLTGLASQYLNPFITFAQLPGGSGVLQPGPFVGQEFVITDGPASVSFRQNISVGGGPTQVKVRYGNTGSGNAWIACG